MYKSDVPVSALIYGVSHEVTVSPEIGTHVYLNWYNELMSLLYTRVIRHEILLHKGKKRYTVRAKDIDGLCEIPLDTLPIPANTGIILPQDITRIYISSPFGQSRFISHARALNASHLFDNTCRVQDETIYIKCEFASIAFSQGAEYLDVSVYAVERPVKVTLENINTTIPLPEEFHNMIRAKLRGEAYKLFSEDSIAAKWLGDYNAMLEDFKTWQSQNRPLL